MPTETEFASILQNELKLRGVHWSQTAVRRRARRFVESHTHIEDVGLILDQIADPTPRTAIRNIERRAHKSNDCMDAALRLGLVGA